MVETHFGVPRRHCFFEFSPSLVSDVSLQSATSGWDANSVHCGMWDADIVGFWMWDVHIVGIGLVHHVRSMCVFLWLVIFALQERPPGNSGFHGRESSDPPPPPMKVVFCSRIFAILDELLPSRLPCATSCCVHVHSTVLYPQPHNGM